MKPSDITGKHLGNKVQTVLRVYVGRGKLYSLAHTARISNLSNGTIEKLLRGESGVRGDTLLKLFTVPELGPALINALIAPMGYAVADILPGKGCYKKIHTELTAVATVIGKAREDNKIDHTEKPEIHRGLEKLNQRLTRAVVSGAE